MACGAEAEHLSFNSLAEWLDQAVGEDQPASLLAVDIFTPTDKQCLVYITIPGLKDGQDFDLDVAFDGAL